MATKTISIGIEAYSRLVSARRHPKESFSEVIKRAGWSNEGASGGELLAILDQLPTLPPGLLAELDDNQKSDLPPTDKWR
ncbi:MAG: antitoxin VapB family protein [Chthoniobacterales bacterium]|jgi:Putative antitoxin|nr:antitoxin VapB family protein [Chthoniobacterales bacterium]